MKQYYSLQILFSVLFLGIWYSEQPLIHIIIFGSLMILASLYNTAVEMQPIRSEDIIEEIYLNTKGNELKKNP